MRGVGRWLPGVADIRPGSGSRSSLGLGEESGGCFSVQLDFKGFFFFLMNFIEFSHFKFAQA